MYCHTVITYSTEVVKGNVSPIFCNNWNYMVRFLNSLMSHVNINHKSCKNIIYVYIKLTNNIE